MAPNSIYCHGEQAHFDADQFAKNPGGNLVTPYVHLAGRPHYASTGAAVDPGDTPPLAMSYGDRQRYLTLLKAAIEEAEEQS